MKIQPTVIVLLHELMAIGLYNGLEEYGIRPGKDIAIIGFRENSQSRFLRPKLGCYRLSLDDLGIELGTAMVAEITAAKGSLERKPYSKVWPLEFVAGDSDCDLPEQ